MNFIAEILTKHFEESPEYHFIFDEQTPDGLTYKEYYDLSGRVYSYLKNKGIGKEDFVLIKLERGINPFIALMGVWRAGAAFTIVENTDPTERIKYIYNDCNCKLEINEDVWEDILKTEPLNGYEDVDDHDAAYAVYTSGTTGNPKGVLHEYGNLKEACDSFYHWGNPIFAEDENFAFIASFSFAALTMYCIPLFNQKKSKIHIIPNSIKKESVKLLSYLKTNKITSIFLSPSYVKVIGEEKLSFLKKLFIGSEPINGIIPPKGVAVYNTYGMSESGFWVGLFKIDKKYDIYPIGQPQFNKKVYLLDENNNEVADGEVGELCFDNPYVRGYIKLPEENKKAFQNGIYHSNDLAKRLPNTDYVIIGRKNDMVKINGNRVEPAEVEAVIRNELNIDWCGVRGFEDYENAYLAAYYTADIPDIDINEIREKLSKKLPYYMLPSYFIKIDKIPVNKNGKFDRKALPIPELKAEDIVLPETDFEKQMFDVVSKELKIKDFGVTTNLILMGLTSIKAIKLSASIKKETNYSIKTSGILSEPFIREWINFADKDIEKIEIIEKQKTYPLTPNQLGIFIDWERNKNGLQYNIPMLLKLNSINPEKLLDSVKKVIELHPYFKVHLIENDNGEILQKRRDDEELQILFEKLDNEPDNKFFKNRVKSFNLLKDNLSRFEIYYTDKNTYLFMDIHHILFDGSSANVLLSDILKSYEYEELNQEKATAYDYSLFYENWKQSENYTKAEKYFSNLVADTESFTYPSVNSNAQSTGKRETYTGQVKKQEIKDYCLKLGITENVFFATVLTQVLHKISREETIQIATISSGRSLEQLSNTIGMFVQTLPLVSKNQKGKVADLLNSMQEQIIATINNDKYPYTELVEKYDVKPNILYAYQGDVIDKDFSSEFERISIETDSVITPMSINITPEKDIYSLSFEYDNGLYTFVEIEKLSLAISNFAMNLVANSVKVDIQTIPLVSAEETQELITLGTGEKLDYDKSETFVDLFLEQVIENPNSIAVVDYKSSITYAELDKQTNILANILIEKGIKPNDFVGIKLPRIKEFMVAVIAIWKSGAAYVPIDPNYPQERIDYMIEDSKAKIVIDEKFLSNIDFNKEVEAINITTPDNLAYMIYTSGSTGKPKGVMIAQKSLMAFVTWLTKELELKQGDNVAEYSSFSFDASLCDLYTSLAKGCTLHILGSDLIKDFIGLETYINENNIIGATLPTQLGMDFINESDTNLRYLILGGDKLKLIKEISTRIYNGYGPTEFTVWATSHIVDFEKDKENIPIGRPVPNSIVAVVDRNGNLLPKGIEGELVLIGTQISKGYWNRDDITKEKFVVCPFIKNKKMYRTGDLVRWNDDNELMFIGRIDNQVKLRGFRIELGEIDAVLSKIKGIKSCVVEIKTIHDIQHLVAYYVSDNELNTEELKNELSRTLTEYMVPDKFVHLDKMPLTPNGKVDRKNLPLPEIETSEYITPVNKTEEIIALNMQDVLNLSVPIGRTDSFLSLGGDSIKSIRLVSKLREAGIVVTVSDIMKAKTVQGISELAKIENTFKADQTDWSGEVELTAIQKEFFNSWKLKTPNHFNQSLMFVASSHIDKEILLKALKKLVCHHDMLRAVYKDGVQYVRKTENEGKLFTLDFVETDDVSVIENKTNELQVSFDIEQGPLFKAILFRKKDADYVFFAIHHLVVDGISWRILIEDLENIYKQIENSQEVKLPLKTMSFKDWSLTIKDFADSELLKREVDYWKSIEAQILNTKHTEKRSRETSHIDRILSANTFNSLRGKALEVYNTEINDLLLTALGRAYKSVMGENVLSIQLEGHGRESINEQTQIDRTIGWFTSICPVIIESHEDIRKNIFHIKEGLRRIPNHGIGYGILKHFSNSLSDKQVIPTLIFNYLGIFKEGGKDNLFIIDNTLPLGHPIAKNNIFGPAMAINCFSITDGSLKIWFDYDTFVWSKNDAESFADSFIEEINNIVEHTLNADKQECSASDLGENFWSNREFFSVIEDFETRNEKIERIYPLTSMQNSMLLKAIAEPDTSAYHVLVRLKLDILPSYEQLSYAFNKLLDKHEVLRTSIIYKNISEPRQAIISERKVFVGMLDISGEQDINRACVELEEKLFNEPVDLQYSPLFKLTCAKTSENSASLIFIMHHIILDGWCNSIWINDFLNFLTEAINNNENKQDYTNFKGKFENFVRDILSYDKTKAKKYWDKLLDGYEIKTEITPHEKITNENRAKANEINLELSVEDTDKLKETCKKASCTINNAVEAAIGLLLQKYNRVDDSLFVKVVSGRDNSKEDISDVVGICLNSVPVRVKTDKEDRISDLLSKVQQQSMETNEYDWYPLSDIQAESELKNNLFQIIYAFENYEVKKSSVLTSFNVEVTSKETNIADIGFAAFVADNRLKINVKFDTNKFSKIEIERVMNVLQNILTVFAKTPENKVSSIILVSAEETEELITLGTGEKLDYDKTETFVDLFIKHVKANPENIAVVDYKSSITYSELDKQSDVLANILIKKGVKPNDFVGVKLPRIKEFMISVIAIWKSGAAYVPIDPEYPQERINYMIEDSQSKLLIDEEFLSNIDFNQNVKPINIATSDNLAYMIYTSGSTGTPKGVMITHGNLKCFISWLGNMVHIKPNDNIGEYVSFCFDGSTGDLYPSLANGATLHILSSELRKDIIQLKEYISKNKIRGMVLITSMAMAILEDGEVDLDYMLVGGEAVIPFKPTNINFYNVYGPTEFTNMSVVGLVDQTFPYNSVPIGRPVPNSTVAVVDENNNLLPRGIEGELVLIGSQISKGYWNRPELTKEKFVDCPFIKNEKMYKTGDLVRWNENNELMFIGRIDNQVKLRGFRIELGEIESVLSKINGIKSCVAEVKTINDTQHLVAYYVSEQEINSEVLKNELSKTLTEYMIPNIFVHLDKMPLTPNGKIDRKKLPLPQKPIQDKKQIRELTYFEEELSKILATVLKNDDFDIYSDFVELGLTSISAMKFTAMIYKKFNYNIKVSDILNKCNILKLENILQKELLITRSDNVENNQKTESTQEILDKVELISAQEGVYYDSIKNPNSTIYNIPTEIILNKKLNENKIKNCLEQLFKYHKIFNCYIVSDEKVYLKYDQNLKFDVSVKEMSDKDYQEYKNIFVKPFLLQEKKLFRCEVVKTELNIYILFDIHHIIFDGTSWGIFIKELKNLYEDDILPNEANTVFDYAKVEKDLLNSNKYTEAKNFFDTMLENFETCSGLPTDMVSNSIGKLKVAEQKTNTEKILNFCKKNDITPAQFFLSAISYTLNRYVNNKEIFISTITNGRNNPIFNNTLGMFVKTLPFASKIENGKNVLEFIRQTGEKFIDVIDNDIYTLTEVNKTYNYVPKILYTCQLGLQENNTIENTEIIIKPLIMETPKVPLVISIENDKEDIVISMHYDGNLYFENTIKEFAYSINVVVNNFIDNFENKIEHISLIDKVREKKLQTIRQGKIIEIDEKILHKKFEKCVDLYPDKTSLVTTDGKFTYKEIEENSNKIAQYLIAKGIQVEDKVLFILSRTSKLIFTILGILKSGACYIPCIPEYPKERIDEIILDSNAKFVICEGDNVSLYKNALDVDEILKFKNTARPNVDVKSNNLAYMIYTSGTTGKPKGVLIEHQSVSNILISDKSNHQTYNVTKSGSCLSLATIAFDMASTEIFTGLCNCQKLVFADEEQTRDVIKLTELINKTKTKSIITTPSRMQQFIEWTDFCRELKDIKSITCGAEGFPITLYNRLKNITSATIINGYGPTENTMFVNTAIISDKTNKITIGKPIPNTIEFIADIDGNELPAGIMGELYIGGIGTARGYQNNKELTDKKFIMFNGERVYKSGDFAKWTENGEIDILGRIDNQVKLRGLRIELDEVNGTILSFENITNSIVLVKKINGEENLCAYFTASSEIDIDKLKEHLSGILPHYMVPSFIMQLEKFPTNKNGKLNKQELPEFINTETKPIVHATNKIEQDFCNIFSNILNNKNISITDNFFEIGGTSLLVTRVILEAKKLNYNINYGDVFNAKTPQKLAQLCNNTLNDNNSNDEIDNFDYSKINDLLKENNIDNFLKGETYKLKDVLLTGATGFLGIHILVDFLKNEKGKIYCLLRKGRFSSVKERLTELLMYYFGENIYVQYEDRIITIEGDITDTNTFKNLKDLDINAVFNCAANVKHYSQDDTIRQVNYIGILNLIDLCKKKNIRLIQTSTTSISGFSINDSLPFGTKLDEQKLYYKQNLDNKYIYSKFLAERQVLDEVSKGNLDGKIMRLGNLSSRNSDGEFQINSGTNSFMSRFRAYNKLGCYPYSAVNESAELSPIDCVARAIILLSTTPKQCSVFHPFNNHVIRMGDIATIMQNNGLEVNFVEDNKYVEALKRVQEQKENAEILSSIVAYQDIAHGNKVQVIEALNNYTTQILYRLGYSMPITEENYINKVFDSLIGLGFFE